MTSRSLYYYITWLCVDLGMATYVQMTLALSPYAQMHHLGLDMTELLSPAQWPKSLSLWTNRGFKFELKLLSEPNLGSMSLGKNIYF